MLTPHRLAAALAFALLFAILYIFCYLMPMAADDFAFQASVPSYGDIFGAVLHKYMTWDGRAIVFFFNHTLLYLPHSVASGLLALMFCVLTLLIHVHIYGRAWRKELCALSVLWVAALLWAVVPGFGAAFFWRAGSTNGYTATLLLLFLLPYRFALGMPPEQYTLRQLPPWQVFLFFLFSLYVGLHDYSIPLILALFSLSICLYHKYILRKPSPFDTLFFWAGMGLLLSSLLVLGAPGNIARMNANPAHSNFAKLSIFEKISKYLAKIDFVQSWFLILYLFLAWGMYVLLRKYGRHMWRRIPLWGYIFLGLAQLAITSFVLSPALPTRTFTSTTVFLIIGSGIIVHAARAQAGLAARRILAMGQGLVLTFCLFSIPYEMDVISDVNTAAHARLKTLETAQGTACIPSYSLTEDRFLPIGSGDRNEIHDVTEDGNSWMNKDLARRYGLNAVMRCPVPNRYFTPDDTSSLPLTIKLVDHHMVFEKNTPPASEAYTLEVLYPSKVHVYMNPNPATRTVHQFILEYPVLYRALVPWLYQRKSITLQPDASGILRAAVEWDYITPEPMHFFVRIPQQNILIPIIETG